MLSKVDLAVEIERLLKNILVIIDGVRINSMTINSRKSFILTSTTHTTAQTKLGLSSFEGQQ